MNRYVFVLLSFALLFLPLESTGSQAWAQSATPHMSAQFDSNVVAVGDSVELTMTVSTEDGDDASDPDPGKTPGFRVERPRVATSRTMSIVNGRRSDGVGLNVTWTFHALKVGTFSIGPPSVKVGRQRFGTPPITIRVVAPGQAPPRNHDPFADPFGNGGVDPLQALLGGMMDAPQQPEPTFNANPALGLDAPRGRSVFLHATIDKANAVVGEQVTLTVSMYIDINNREPAVNDIHEATATDFLKKSLREDDSTTEPVGIAMVAGQPWAVKVVRRSALFPLRTGDLAIGPMSLAIVGRGGTSGQPRESETLRVHVTEPPMAGRPPGYTVGDVGHFAVNAEVSPRTIDQDGAIGVEVDLTGSGNLPGALPLPTQPGIEWLTPETRDKLGPLDGGKYGGTRHFSYIVRLHKPGHVDLGDITLPFWDSDAHVYSFARAQLKSVDVTPGTNAQNVQLADGGLAPVGNDSLDVLAGLPAPMTTLAGAPSVREHRTDKPIFWIGLFGAPFAVVAASGVSSFAKRLRAKNQEKATSPLAEWKEKVAIGDRVMKDGDPQGDAAVLRALHVAPLAFFGVSIRGAQNEEEVARLLEDAGVKSAKAQQYAELVHACEVDRYAPEPAPIETIRARWVVAKKLMNELRS